MYNFFGRLGFKKLGISLYTAEQQRKKVLLNHLLNTYNDGRKKTLFCIAVNLLEIDDLENIINELDKNTLNLSLKEKAAYAASLLQRISVNKNIILRLRKKGMNNKANACLPNDVSSFDCYTSPSLPQTT